LVFNHTGWIHDVSDVWMNGWVLKKLSKEVFDGFVDDVKDIKQELQHMYVCVPHVRKSTTHRDRSLLGKLSIILSLKLASMSHSCPHMSGHCDVITPPL
jgi:hypothetical protein